MRVAEIVRRGRDVAAGLIEVPGASRPGAWSPTESATAVAESSVLRLGFGERLDELLKVSAAVDETTDDIGNTPQGRPAGRCYNGPAIGAEDTGWSGARLPRRLRDRERGVAQRQLPETGSATTTSPSSCSPCPSTS